MSDCTIALSGLSDTDAATFEAAIDALPGHRWQVTSGAPATLLVVDIDTVWGHMDWLRATANGQQVAAFTRDTQVRNCDMVLHKPLHPGELAQLLAPLAGGSAAGGAERPSAVREAPAPAAPSRAAPTPVAEPPVLHGGRDNIAPAPAAWSEPGPELEPAAPMTLGECLLAGNITTPMAIRTSDGTRLVLDPQRGGYAGTGSGALKPLATLLRTPITQALALDESAVSRMREAPALPLTRLLWFAAMCASPGQLAPTLDPDASYHLARWPQIEREFPRHFRIATAMMKGPATLDEIAAASNTPAGDVADFINAYSVAGYVSCTMPAAMIATPAPGSGMFSRLRRPFTRNG